LENEFQSQLRQMAKAIKMAFRIKISIHLGSNFHTFGSFEIDFGFVGFGLGERAQSDQIGCFCL
jgi:hypothetical protein